MLHPTATYSLPDIEPTRFVVNPAEARFQTTDGKTTGASPHVLNAGQVDRDKPSEPRRTATGEMTPLGQLRANLTGLQDDINEFLTHRMELAKGKKAKTQQASEQQEKRIQNEIKELLDGRDDDEEPDEN